MTDDVVVVVVPLISQPDTSGHHSSKELLIFSPDEFLSTFSCYQNQRIIMMLLL
jgi:hypothetical protein